MRHDNDEIALSGKSFYVGDDIIDSRLKGVIANERYGDSVFCNDCFGCSVIIWIAAFSIWQRF